MFLTREALGHIGLTSISRPQLSRPRLWPRKQVPMSYQKETARVKRRQSWSLSSLSAEFRLMLYHRWMWVCLTYSRAADTLDGKPARIIAPNHYRSLSSRRELWATSSKSVQHIQPSEPRGCEGGQEGVRSPPQHEHCFVEWQQLHSQSPSPL